MARAPYLLCTYMDTPSRRVLNLAADGLPEIVALGRNKVDATVEGAKLHRHRAIIELTYCVRGTAKFECNDAVYSVLPGQVFLTHPEDVHRLCQNTVGLGLRWVFFRLPAKDHGVFGLSADESDWLVQRLRSVSRHVFDGSSEILGAFDDLFRAYDHAPQGSSERRLRLRQAALNLLIAFADAAHRLPRGDGKDDLKRVIGEMRRHPEMEFSEDRLIELTKLSASTIASRFKQLTGLPPHAFLLKCRVHAAQALLGDGERTIEEIATRLHFASPQHFASRFRRETGQTPSAYRAAWMYKKS